MRTLNQSTEITEKLVTFECQVNFHAFVIVCLLISKSTFSKKILKNTIRVSKNLDPGQALFRIQTVYKENQQTTTIGASKKRFIVWIKNTSSVDLHCLQKMV